MDTFKDRVSDRTVHSLPAPLLPAAIGLTIGIVLDNAVEPGRLVYVGLVALVGAVLAIGFTRRRFAWLLSGSAAIALGGLLHDGAYRRVPTDHIVHYATDAPTLVRITGTVVSPPRVSTPREHFFSRWSYGQPGTRFILRIESIQGKENPIYVAGRVAVRVDGEGVSTVSGDRVSVFGMMYRPRPASNPGQFDYSKWQRRNGVHVAMRCPHANAVTVLARGADRFRSWTGRFREFARAMVLDEEAAVGDEESTLLETLVLGRRHAIDPRVEELFVHTGTAHFLAVSGFHVGIVGWFVWYIGRRLGGTKRRSALFTALAITLYAVLADPRPPVFRATIIGLVYCASVMLRRPASSINSTALAAIILLVIRPTMLFGPGFQMSFVGVLAIIYLQPAAVRLWRRWIDRERADEELLLKRKRDRSVVRRWRRRSYETFRAFASLSIVACLASTPLVVLYFGHIVPLAPLHTIVVFPFVVVTLLVGLGTIAAGAVWPILTEPAAALAGWSASVLLSVIGLIHDRSPSFRGWAVVPFQLLSLALVGALIGSVRVGTTTIGSHVRVWVHCWFHPEGAPLAAKRVGATVAAVFIMLSSSALALLPANHDAALRVTVLSVGRGSSTVIEFPNGACWLYDCGTNANYDVGAGTIVPYCRTRGIKQLDRIVVSHANLDHYNGLFSVIDAVSVGPVALNQYFEPHAKRSAPAAAMLEELRRRGHAIDVSFRIGETNTLDGVAVETLWPPDHLPEGWSSNDSSTVMRLTYGGRSVLLCGDIEERAIAALLERGGLEADVLVLPHHGSVEANTKRFVDAVNPSVCIASSNRSLPSGGDGTETQRRSSEDTRALSRVPTLWGRTLFNTTDRGAVTVTVQNRRLDVHSFRSPQLTPIGVENLTVR
ncbi:MAG: ComEC/Rec2 family competence protein [Planctomycetes bacterium]|nr:ComEC/Rec2 family competence protein [Planctomycetota bacterium]